MNIHNNNNRFNNIINYNNNINNNSKYIAINTVSHYISQAFNNLDYNNALNIYSECLQTILNTILNKVNDTNISENITNLINNETNIHTIIVYTIQMIKEKHYSQSVSTTFVVDSKTLLKDISQIQTGKDAFDFIKQSQKWLYLNCHFKRFLTKIIELNLSDIFENRMTNNVIHLWKCVYNEIINNYHYNGNNLYLINTIWYQQLRIILLLYNIITTELIMSDVFDDNGGDGSLKNVVTTLRSKEEELKLNIQSKENENKMLIVENNKKDARIQQLDCEMNDNYQKIHQLEEKLSQNKMQNKP